MHREFHAVVVGGLALCTPLCYVVYAVLCTLCCVRRVLCWGMTTPPPPLGPFTRSGRSTQPQGRHGALP